MWGPDKPRRDALSAAQAKVSSRSPSTKSFQHHLVAMRQQSMRGMGGPLQQAPHTRAPSIFAPIECGRWRAAHPHRRPRHDSAGRGELQDALQRQRQPPVRRSTETAASQAGGGRVGTLMACCSRQLGSAEGQQPQRQRRRRRLTL